jgi:hypothetical protein
MSPTALTPAVHEKGLALFVEPRYRNRFRESFANPRRRDKLRRKLAHFVQLDPRYTEKADSKKQRGANVESALRDRGAPERCYLLSEDSELDGREMLLSDALAETVDAASEKSTFISCIPGKLAYFHGEGAENRLILERAE